MMDLQQTFIREIEVEATDLADVTLGIHQAQVGDVGCVVWDAALVLAYYLQTEKARKNHVINKSIIELGSGTGVVGLVAAACGARKVILTDLPEMTPLLEKNIKDNVSNWDQSKSSVMAAPYTWGSKRDLNHLFSHENCDGGGILHDFDTILIADCVYYQKAVEPLAQTIYDLLSTGDQNVSALCCYEDRDTGDKAELQEIFREILTGAFKLEVDFIAYNDMHHRFRSPDIHIFHITKKE